MIQLINVNKYFYKGESREVQALCNINLRINEGEFSLLNGPSGCGKTTLLNNIGALDSPQSGEIFLADTAITSLNEDQKTRLRLNEMGFVFQAYNLVPVLSVEENIGFIMKLRGFENSIIKQRVLEVASLLKIDNKLHALPATLSGGQQQRVAVARAVAAKPKIILADEPTANLDSKNSKILMQMMSALNEKEGVTIIFASHDEYVIDSVRRIIKLNDGEIIES
jgi:putative ABC transport system ATP-binding protein